LFYLARVERKRGNHAREKVLLEQALRDYPDEDMVHEMAWEVHQALFRGGKFQEFIDAVTALPLPDYDTVYYSQGRLEYFLAASHDRLGQKKKAADVWQENWQKYPFSFYGYLSNLRLRERGVQPAALDGSPAASRTDWFDAAWTNEGAARLVRLQLFEEACDFETAHLSRQETTASDRWRQATICHLASRYPVSHNIARRQIPGRPWAEPEAGRLIRWQVAWPNPFANQITEAVTAERALRDEGLFVDGALASAIMREESAFIVDNVSWAGALGLMQLMPATALGHDKNIEGRATPDRLLTADVNIRVAIDHIFSLANRFDSHPVLMTAAYNAGGGRITQWLRRFPNTEIALFVEDIPFLETRNYTKRVIGSYAAYQWLAGEREFDTRVAKGAPRK
ncbi:MAG: transglycosylase SLT domain-containing protein, partial [Bradymonadaceae bacterium]